MRTRVILLTVAILLSAAPASAQTMPADPPTATQPKPDDATTGIGQRAPSDRFDDSRVNEGRRHGENDGPPANPPTKDETVGSGRAIDRAPRDIREPFDE